MGKAGEKLDKVAKSCKKWRKVGISGEKWNKWGKLGKSWKKWDFFGKMAAPAILDDQKHFGSHLSPFQINTQFFFKMATSRHFGSPYWAILDDRKSLSIAFLAISDQYATIFF